MTNDGPHGDEPNERRRLLQQALGGLSALALLRGMGGCSSESSSEPATGLTPSAPDVTPPPAAPSGTAGASAAPPSTPPSLASAATPPAINSAPAAPSSSASPPVQAQNAPVAAKQPSARVACEVVVPTFPSLADGGPSTTFTRMDQSTTADWIAIGGATSRLAAKVPDGILNLLKALDKLYVGYPISVLSHSLQAATRARQANASDDLVLGALCHDIGMAITVEGHAEVSASIMRGYVSDNAYQIVRHHTEFEWLRGGAPAGQPTDQRNRYQSQPWFSDAVRFVDEWVAVSYDPKFASRTLSDFEALVRSKFSAGGVNTATSMDCLPKNTGKMP